MIEMSGLRRVSAVIRALARLRPSGRRCCPGKAQRDRERHTLEGAYASLLGAGHGPARGWNYVGQHAIFASTAAQARRLPRSARSTVWVSRAVAAAPAEGTRQHAAVAATGIRPFGPSPTRLALTSDVR